MTAWLSTSQAWASIPISLANVIFNAWNALHAYFTISAVSTVT